MLAIGTKFDYDWYYEDDDNYDNSQEYDEVVMVGGYIYYEETLYYTCVGMDTGAEVDVYGTVAERRAGDYHED